MLGNTGPAHFVTMNIIRDEWNNWTSEIRSRWHESGDIVHDAERYRHNKSGFNPSARDPHTTVKKGTKRRRPIPLDAALEPIAEDSVKAPKYDQHNRRPMPYRRSGYRRRVRPRLRRRFRRYRRGRFRTKFRRRARWGTRVRRAAIKMGESKRNIDRETDFNLNPRYTSDHPSTASRNNARVYFRELANMSHITSVSSEVSQKSQRKGTFVNATGLKFRAQFKNILAGSEPNNPQPLFLRIIIGYKKRDRQSQASFEGSPTEEFTKDAVQIFKSTVDEQNVALNTWRTDNASVYYEVMNAPVDRHYVKVFRDYKLRLLDTNVQDTGANVAHINTWIPFRNRPIKFENTSAGDSEDTDWWPCMWVYCCSAEMNNITPGVEATPTEAIQMTWESILYFRDP